MTAGKNNDFMQKAGIAAGAAVVGAAVGAAAVAMTDPAIKKKVVAGVKNLEKRFEKGRDTLMDKVDDAKKQVAKKLE